MAASLEERRLENIVGALSLALVDKMEQAFHAETNRGPSAIAAINQIGAEPGLTIERLRRIIALSHSASVRLVDQLVADGFVIREVGADGDRRARALRLTEEGEALLCNAREARRQVAAGALARLSAGEREALDAIIGKMFQSLMGPEDDDEVVCRMCDESACPQDRCPVPRKEA
jgi:MarR family transcriptional repressor of emrRAB